MEWKVTAEPFPAMFGGKILPVLDRCNNLFFRRPTLLQSILGMWMQSDFHNKSTLTSGIGTTNLPSHSRMGLICSMISPLRFQGRISFSGTEVAGVAGDSVLIIQCSVQKDGAQGQTAVTGDQ